MFREFARDELFDSMLYAEMANRAKNEETRKALLTMSQQERSHYEFWRKYAGDIKITFKDRIMLKIYLFMGRILGTVFTVKFLERREGDTSNIYRRILEEGKIREEDEDVLKRIIEEEEIHENYFVSQVDEFALRYLGAIALGIADAIIELTGVQAGFIGFTGSSVVTGIAGLIVGVSASMSMAAAAYLQAKQEKGKKPAVTALTTGIAYLFTVIALTVPYFVNFQLLMAFSASLTLALVILAFFSFYSSVIFDRKFLSDYLENMGIIFLVVAIGYFFGNLVKNFFGIELFV
ncbi:MAG: rubrerythrin family protein [Thermoprotei archaeon]|nr:MAG: rubrerythrin family protein [Thermoprotei archaeon]